MKVVKWEDGKLGDPTKPPPRHSGWGGISLHGKDTGTQRIAVSVAHFVPGGGNERGPRPTPDAEVILYILSGSMTIKTGKEEATLNPNDSVYFPPGEERETRNNGVVPLTYLVIR